MHLDCQMEMTGMKGSAKGEAAENVLDGRSWPDDKGGAVTSRHQGISDFPKARTMKFHSGL